MNRNDTDPHFRHSEYEQTQHAFRTSGGISLITKVLSTAQHWAVIKAACGLIRNLALNAANIPFFKDTGKPGQLAENDREIRKETALTRNVRHQRKQATLLPVGCLATVANAFTLTSKDCNPSEF
jgi:hypothetical protein